MGSKRIAYDEMNVNKDTFEFMLQPSFRVYKNLPARERAKLGIKQKSKEIITAKLDIKKSIVEFNPDEDTNKPFRAEDIYSF